MLGHAYIVFVGILFGLANVIPGVSGGTMAVVFGVYERLINIVANLKTMWKKELPFLLEFGIGAGIGIVGFGKVMDWVLAHYPVEASCFFIGVILGSIPMLIGLTFKGEGKHAKWQVSFSNILPMLITFGIMIPMALNNTEAAKVGAVAREITGFNLVDELLFVVYGVIAVTTMIVPGISGSFVMLLLGFYGTIINAVATLNFLVLVPFAIGCLIGVIFTTKLIKWLLNRFPTQSYSAILGFVFGSILCIFPGWSNVLNVWPILMIAAGFAMMIACNKLTNK